MTTTKDKKGCKSKLTQRLFLAAGKLAMSARLVTTANAKNISQRIEQMERDLDFYDNEIIQNTKNI